MREIYPQIAQISADFQKDRILDTAALAITNSASGVEHPYFLMGHVGRNKTISCVRKDAI